MNLTPYEEFMQTEAYKKFIEENPAIGSLKIQAFTAYQAIPIPDTEILITKKINDQQILFFKGYTDSSGIIENIELPAPPSLSSNELEAAPAYTIYDLTAINEGYETIKRYEIGMFGDIKVIQYVKMTPQIELTEVNQDGN